MEEKPTKKRNKNLNKKEEEDEGNESLLEDEQVLAAEMDAEEEIGYEKFFDEPKDKVNPPSPSSSYSGDEIFSQIKEIESQMLQPKDWTLRGEVLGKDRPKDAILGQSLDFEVGVKAPPVPTKEYTKKIEDVIKLRIKDDLFDDPVVKREVKLGKGGVEVNFEKSKKGLSEIYEDKYTGNDRTEKKLDEIKTDIEALCGELFNYLSKMTNGTGPVYSGGVNKSVEGEIITENVPVISLEEVGNFVGDNNALNMNMRNKENNGFLNKKLIREKNKVEMNPEELKRLHNRNKRNIRAHIHKKQMERRMEMLTAKFGSKFEARFHMKKERDKEKKKKESKESNGMNNMSSRSDFKSANFFGKMRELAEQ